MRWLALSALLVGCLPTGPEPLETTTWTLTADAPHADLTTDAGDAGAWDVRLDGWNLFLNGGESGEGRAGGIDIRLLDLELQFDELLRSNQILFFFFFDSYGCALSDWWWYGLDGTHTLFSNFHTYVVQRGDRSWAWQLLDYYRPIENAAVAGHPEFRFVEIGTVDEPTVVDLDATAGGLGADPDDPANRWTYFSFDDGVLDLEDAEAVDDPDWDLGFKRFDIKSNSGPSGPGGVLTADPDADRGETPEDVLGFTAANQAGRFDERVAAWEADPTAEFVADDVRPVLDRWFSGEPGSAALVDGRWFLVSDRTGGEVAKLRVIDLVDGDAAGPESVTLEWALLP